jgi:hypothetical protein
MNKPTWGELKKKIDDVVGDSEIVGYLEVGVGDYWDDFDSYSINSDIGYDGFGVDISCTLKGWHGIKKGDK